MMGLMHVSKTDLRLELFGVRRNIVEADGPSPDYGRFEPLDGVGYVPAGGWAASG